MLQHRKNRYLLRTLQQHYAYCYRNHRFSEQLNKIEKIANVRNLLLCSLCAASNIFLHVYPEHFAYASEY